MKIIQYRNKFSDAATILTQARELKRLVGSRATLIMNDRADLCLAAEFDGVHVGQDDLSPESARKIIGMHRWLGVQRTIPSRWPRLIALLPTTSSARFLPPRAKSIPTRWQDWRESPRSELTRKPLVAIGGITRQNCASVFDAGADSIAVISDLVRDPRKSAEEFLRILG